MIPGAGFLAWGFFFLLIYTGKAKEKYIWQGVLQKNIFCQKINQNEIYKVLYLWKKYNKLGELEVKECGRRYIWLQH